MTTTELPLVSIIVPLYNHEKFITRCLDSIVSDSYPLKEIIVIDDGSTDSSVSVVKEWYRNTKDSLNKNSFKFISRENKGVTKTLNELISMANGEFIVPIASDDYLLDGGIQIRVDYLLRNASKMAVFADCIVVDENDAKIFNSGISELYKGNKYNFLHPALRDFELIYNWSVPGPVFMARKGVFNIVGGYDEELVVEDWDLYLRLAAQNLLGFIDHPVAAYRLHSNNSIKNNFTYHFRSMKLTAEKNISNFSGLKKIGLLAIKVYYDYKIDKCTPRKYCKKLVFAFLYFTSRFFYKIWFSSVKTFTRHNNEEWLN